MEKFLLNAFSAVFRSTLFFIQGRQFLFLAEQKLILNCISSSIILEKQMTSDELKAYSYLSSKFILCYSSYTRSNLLNYY